VRADFFVSLEHLRRGSLPAKAPQLFSPPLNESAAKIVVEKNLAHAAGDVETFSGFTTMAASPMTSGSELTFEQTTGVPQAMASKGGKPNPSYSDGKTNADAA